MQLLITRTDIAKYKQISKTPHDDKLNEQILDAQIIDLQPLLGERLYNKILNAPENYTDLLNGGPYSHNEESFNCYGLKMILSYYAYARYVMFGSSIDTPFSIVEKLNENSRPVENTQKKSIYILNRESASQLWDNIKNYLVRTNNPDFNHCNRPTMPGGMKFTKIG
jgi:hypothetical protein